MRTLHSNDPIHVICSCSSVCFLIYILFIQLVSVFVQTWRVTRNNISLVPSMFNLLYPRISDLAISTVHVPPWEAYFSIDLGPARQIRLTLMDKNGLAL